MAEHLHRKLLVLSGKGYCTSALQRHKCVCHGNSTYLLRVQFLAWLAGASDAGVLVCAGAILAASGWRAGALI